MCSFNKGLVHTSIPGTREKKGEHLAKGTKPYRHSYEKLGVLGASLNPTGCSLSISVGFSVKSFFSMSFPP